MSTPVPASGAPLSVDSPVSSASRPLFPLGQLLATPGALRLLERYDVSALALLSRHVRGDWGELGPDDQQVNAVALQDGRRLMSSYRLSREEGGRTVLATLWVITEADRSSTTILQPSEY